VEASLLKAEKVAQMCGVLDGVKPERTGEEYTAVSFLERLTT
jgi:hypothetical protein